MEGLVYTVAPRLFEESVYISMRIAVKAFQCAELTGRKLKSAKKK